MVGTLKVKIEEKTKKYYVIIDDSGHVVSQEYTNETLAEAELERKKIMNELEKIGIKPYISYQFRSFTLAQLIRIRNVLNKTVGLEPEEIDIHEFIDWVKIHDHHSIRDWKPVLFLEDELPQIWKKWRESLK